MAELLNAQSLLERNYELKHKINVLQKRCDNYRAEKAELVAVLEDYVRVVHNKSSITLHESVFLDTARAVLAKHKEKT